MGACMKEILFGGIAAAAVGGGIYYFPSGFDSGTNLYQMKQNEAISMLADAPIPVGYGPFSGGDVETTLPEDGVVAWSVIDSDAEPMCRAEIADASEGQVSVTAFCGGHSSPMGATSEVANELQNTKFREFVDSILTRRKYDKAKIERAAIGTVITNMPKMQRDAAQMQKTFSETESEEEDYSTDPSDFGKPSSELAAEE